MKTTSGSNNATGVPESSTTVEANQVEVAPAAEANQVEATPAATVQQTQAEVPVQKKRKETEPKSAV